jgi:hypothetical protein
MGNLLLTFPELAPSDFAPWVAPREISIPMISRHIGLIVGMTGSGKTGLGIVTGVSWRS